MNTVSSGLETWRNTHPDALLALGMFAFLRAVGLANLVKALWIFAFCLPLVGCGGGSGGGSSEPVQPPPPPPANTAWWQASANNRYLVDESGVPTLLVGDSPHSMFVNLSAADLSTYLANRQWRGFNVLWVQGLCSDYIANCRRDLSTYDGIRPFTSGTDETNYDVSTPNEAYWSRVDSYIDIAAAYGLSVLFDTWETAALMPLARANGNSKMRAFGAFLGNRYKNFPNIIWITGNDFQTWTDATDNSLMQNLMAGIASADSNHLQTTQLNYNESGSLDDALLAPYTRLAGAYSYYCSYTQTMSQYNHASNVPVFFEEGFYEYNGTTFGTIRNLRKQAWWAGLNGATAGQLYGSENVYPFERGWQNYLDTTGVVEFGHLNSLLKSIRWYDLVPDQGHVVVTSGYGTFDPGNNYTCIDTNDYVTTSYLADGTASLSYTPQAATLTVDMSKFRGTVTAKWFDPIAGTAVDVPGSPFANSGNRAFPTRGSNSAGDSDWVLVLTAQ